jgi:hypothetical protein
MQVGVETYWHEWLEYLKQLYVQVYTTPGGDA